MIEKNLHEKVISHRKTKNGVEVEIMRVDQGTSTWEPVSNSKSKEAVRNYLKRHDFDLKDRSIWELWCQLDEDPPWFYRIPPDGTKIGRGIKTSRDFEKGSFLLEYKGTFSLREDLDITSDGDYVFAFQHNGMNYSVDATLEDDTLCRLVNDAHPTSGKTNSVMFKIVLEDNKRPLRLVLIATKDIKRGEELFLYYGHDDQLWYNPKENIFTTVYPEEDAVANIVSHRMNRNGVELEIQYEGYENTILGPISMLKSEEPLKNYLKSRDFSLKDRGTLELWCNLNEDPPWFDIIPADGRKSGRGVKALKDIEKGSFVVEYKGVCSLTKHVPLDHYEYVFDFTHKGTNYSIDSTKDDNALSRLINDAHPNSGMVNCTIKKVILKSSKEQIRLVLTATKNIKCGDELFYFYGYDDQPWYDSKPIISQPIMEDEDNVDNIVSHKVNKNSNMFENHLVEKIINHRMSKKGIEVEIVWADYNSNTWETISDTISKVPLRNYLKRQNVNLQEKSTLELWCYSDEDPPWFEVIPADGRDMGRGIKALKDIENGSFLLEHKGLFSKFEDFHKTEVNHAYVTSAEHNGERYCINATKEDGTLCRLVNDAHPTSEKLNCELKKVVLKNSKRPIRVVLTATRDIKRGEELLYFYGNDHQPWYQLETKRSLETEKPIVSSHFSEHGTDSKVLGHMKSTYKDAFCMYGAIDHDGNSEYSNTVNDIQQPSPNEHYPEVRT